MVFGPEPGTDPALHTNHPIMEAPLEASNPLVYVYDVGQGITR